MDQKKIVEGDIIFLASDGVVDSFGDIENYKCFINDSRFQNTDQFINSLLDGIVASNQKHRDDMSIIAINLLKKT